MIRHAAKRFAIRSALDGRPRPLCADAQFVGLAIGFVASLALMRLLFDVRSTGLATSAAIAAASTSGMRSRWLVSMVLDSSA